MTEPDKDTISLKEVFEKYKEYVSENVDTSELEVYTDDEARYQNVTAEVTVDTRNSIFGGRFCDLVFKCEEDEKLTKEIHLYESKRNGFRITRFESKLDINSLRYVDGETECDGWLIDSPDGRILFITDAEYCPYDFSKMEINYGLIECNYSEDYISREEDGAKFSHVLTGHMELQTCKRLIQSINSKSLTLVLLLSFKHVSQ